MKIFTGKETIAKLNERFLTINWDYLATDLGKRKEKEELDLALGFLLRILAILSILASLLYPFLAHENWIFENLINLNIPQGWFLFLGFCFFIYSFYLLRNRDTFSDNFKSETLIELAKELEDKNFDKKEIELTNYFDHDILGILDDVFAEDPQNFLTFLMQRILSLEEVRMVIPRLGLKLDNFVDINGRLELEGNTHTDIWVKKVLYESFLIALRNNFEKVDELAVFIYLCKDPLKPFLLNFDVQEIEINALEAWVKNYFTKEKYKKIFEKRSVLKPVTTTNRGFTSRYSANLERFSQDYTKDSAKGSYRFSIGRDSEIDKLITFLQEGEKSATLIIGDPGVGKTTFLRSLAVRMVVEDMPKSLQDKRLVNFEFMKAFALSEDVEEFKKILENVLEEVNLSNNIILVLEDFDQLVNVRSQYAGEIISIIIRAIDNYNIRIIATTNSEGYAQHIASNKALVSLFNILRLEEPKDQIAVQILFDEMERFETKYKVKVEFEALTKAVELSHKFDFDRVLPDKALELIDETCSHAVLNGLRFITEHDVEDVVSGKVGVNVGQISSKEQATLLNMENKIHARIIDQEQAVRAVSNALRRARAGLGSDKKPIASFLFFGPTGVGKTELAKAVAAEFYGDEKLMIRLDMSEYQEVENLKRLIGEAKEDEFIGGVLTEAVRKKPFSLILLDEIEKANIRVLDLFLQVLDEGHLTDGMGRKVSFNNTIIVMTSNACSTQIAEMISKGKRYIDVYREVLPNLKTIFKVEFLNRFDSVIMFKPLLPLEILQVTKLLLDSEKENLKEKGIELSYTDNVLHELTDLGYNPVYGAREMKRVIQERIEDKIAKLIIEKKLSSGQIINFNSLEDINVK